MTARRPGRGKRGASSPARARRLALSAGAFGALGVLLSVLVAAVSAVWIPLPAGARVMPAVDPAAAHLLAPLGPLPAHWQAPEQVSEQGRAGLSLIRAHGLLRPDVSMSGAWSATRIEAGFPARCLAARRLWDSEAGDLSGGLWGAGAVLPTSLRPWKHDPRRYNGVLPLRPLPAGLAINTLVWGAALWLTFRGSRLAQRLWRLRRGRCPTCGYPKPDDPAPGPQRCPECGAEWPPEATAASSAPTGDR